jgi:hypothetical protein
MVVIQHCCSDSDLQFAQLFIRSLVNGTDFVDPSARSIHHRIAPRFFYSGFVPGAGGLVLGADSRIAGIGTGAG